MNVRSIFCLPLFYALCLFSPQVMADIITVPNFSFENPSTGGASFSIDDWTQAGDPSGVATNSGFTSFASPADGSQYAFINAQVDPLRTGSLTSGILDADPFSAGTTILGSTTYTLTVAVGNRDVGSPPPDPDDYLIELLSGGTPFASAQLLNADTAITAGTFQDLVASVTTPSSGGAVGGDLTIRLTHSTDLGTFKQGAFDNVRLDATVIPEPSSMVLFAGAAALLLAARRRRR